MQGPNRSEPGPGLTGPIVLSFDVEEHFRIEAAAGLNLAPALQQRYHVHLETSTRWLLDELRRHEVRATFFVLGVIARDHPDLVRALHRAGHEVASHGWNHCSVRRLTPAQFRTDVQASKDALEQITGEAVVGYRAPTFSIVRPTAWALDVLAELGLLYDSSIYPVWHDRYGVSEAPRSPFWAGGVRHSLLELPPTTLRLLGLNLPVGGGGYFRLLPLPVLEAALRQPGPVPAAAMLYFHPWEFDPQQPRLPLPALSRFRTYVGLFRARARLKALLARYRFRRAVDVARQLLQTAPGALPHFSLAQPQAAAKVPCSPFSFRPDIHRAEPSVPVLSNG